MGRHNLNNVNNFKLKYFNFFFNKIKIDIIFRVTILIFMSVFISYS